MKLYHFTHLNHLIDIIKDKELKLTDSNLLTPTSPFRDLTSLYKPVVWFSKTMSFKDAEKGIGVKFRKVSLEYDKSAISIAVDTSVLSQDFFVWHIWAKENGIEDKWFKRLIRTAPSWKSFYITEKAVPLADDTQIFLRTDIAKRIGTNKMKFTLKEFEEQFLDKIAKEKCN